MPGSIQIATIRGIPIRVHLTLFVLFGFFVYHLGLIGVPAALLLFGSTLLHELGHAVVAQRAGLPIASIELHLLGGTALMQSPKKPRHELVIALAGPVVSLTLGLTAVAIVVATQGTVTLAPTSVAALLPFFAAVNLGMATFNLMPALPMDGGRVLRALLARKLEFLAATRIATRISRAIALSFLIFGAVQGLWTVSLFGVVIWWLAGRELRAAEIQAWRAANEDQLRAWAEVLAQTPLRGLWPPIGQRPTAGGRPRVDGPGDPRGGGPIIDV